MSSSSAAQDGARDVTMSRELNAERQQAVFLRAGIMTFTVGYHPVAALLHQLAR